MVIKKNGLTPFFFVCSIIKSKFVKNKQEREAAMYTKENAEMHKKIMAAIKQDLRRPRTWKEFRQLQKEVQSVSVKNFEQAAQNHQSSFEQVFKNALNGLQMKVIFICNRAATKNLKATAQIVLEKITKIIVDYKKLEEDARKEKYELTFSGDLQKELIKELKRCFKTKERNT